MKTLVLIGALLLSHLSFSSNNPSLKHEIEEAIQPDLSQFEFDMYHENFVVVSFKISHEQLEIIEIMGSNEYLIQLMTEELSNLKMDNIYPVNDIHNFKFIFTKL